MLQGTVWNYGERKCKKGVKNVQEQLEKARKRLRICLIAVVLLAIVAGCAYYFCDFSKERDVTEGTLVKEIQGTEIQGTDADVFALYNERIRNIAAPGGHIYGWQ